MLFLQSGTVPRYLSDRRGEGLPTRHPALPKEEGVEEQEEEQEEEEKEEEEEDCQLQTEFRSRPPRTEFWVIPGARNGSKKKYAIPTQMKGLHSKLI